MSRNDPIIRCNPNFDIQHEVSLYVQAFAAHFQQWGKGKDKH